MAQPDTGKRAIVRQVQRKKRMVNGRLIQIGTALVTLAALAACGDSTGPGSKTYSQAVRADVPAVYWRFEETSGTVAADSSGNGRNGAYVGNPTLGAALSSPLGRAITLSHTSGDAVAQGAAPWARFSAFTLEAWIKPSQTQYAEAPIIIDKGSVWNMIITADGHPAIQFPGAPSQRVLGPATLSVGSVYHLVGTYTPGTPHGVMTLYVNGALMGTGTDEPSSIPDQDTPIHVGQGLSPLEWDVAGTIDEVAIYDHALTAEAILNHYNAGK